MRILSNRRRRRFLMAFIALTLIGLLAAPFLLRAYTDHRYDARVYRVASVPARPTAVIFGARVLPNGRPSTMLRDRVATGADLYHAGKVEQLLMTGDNREASYNEPEAMRQYALSLGVPAEAILLDPAGLRTYDSCHRANHRYGIDRAILVTQEFHLDRALLLCDALGMDVVGVAADYHRPNGYSDRSIRWQNLREIGATAVAYLDLLRRPSPGS
jgi:SanA protein